MGSRRWTSPSSKATPAQVSFPTVIVSSIRKPLNLTNMVLLPCTSSGQGFETQQERYHHLFQHLESLLVLQVEVWSSEWDSAKAATQKLLTTAGAAACHQPEHVRQFPRPAGCSGGWIYTLGTVHREQEGRNNSLRTTAYKTLAIQPQENRIWRQTWSRQAPWVRVAFNKWNKLLHPTLKHS